MRARPPRTSAELRRLLPISLPGGTQPPTPDPPNQDLDHHAEWPALDTDAYDRPGSVAENRDLGTRIQDALTATKGARANRFVLVWRLYPRPNGPPAGSCGCGCSCSG
jgi:hypothetical protein